MIWYAEGGASIRDIVKVAVAQKSGEVLLTVQDTGIGLSLVEHAVQYHHGKVRWKAN